MWILILYISDYCIYKSEAILTMRQVQSFYLYSCRVWFIACVFSLKYWATKHSHFFYNSANFEHYLDTWASHGGVVQAKDFRF